MKITGQIRPENENVYIPNYTESNFEQYLYELFVKQSIKK